MAKKLHYFNVNGLGEPIRYMFHYGGVEFEDIKYETSEWPIESLLKMLPYGQVPLYQEGDKCLNQSMAISRYVASITGLLPSSTWEQALLDAAVLNFYDFIGKTGGSGYLKEQDPEKKAAMLKNTVEEVIPFHLSRFEKELKENNGYFGGKLSWADFVCVGIVECVNLFFDLKIEKDYPAVANLMKTIHNLPGVSEYIANRKPYQKPSFNLPKK